ncbi:JmjC domain-containing protein [Streptomyces sp. NPDC058092]|uniref:JmjC domain-containing protein n=1 Tax=Streptomyces sp. NPDC058092 TaxID=3346336 RepID=UPI0036E28906
MTSAPYVPSFDELVGDATHFLESDYQRNAHLHQNGLRSDPAGVLSIAELDDLLTLRAVGSECLRIVKDGIDVPESVYSRSYAEFGPALRNVVVRDEVYRRFHDGSTLVWGYIDRYHPGLHRLTEALRRRLNTTVATTAFLTPAGQQGFDLHCDLADVFVVQLSGTKRWYLWDRLPDAQPRRESFTSEALGEPALDVSLCPGDVLYMPYNTPHAAVAEDSMSLHLSVIVQPRSWSELLLQATKKLLQEEEFAGALYLEDSRGEELADQFAHRLGRLATRLRELEAAEPIQRLLTKNDSPGTVKTLEQTRREEHVGPTTQVERTELPLVFTEPEDGIVKATFSGTSVIAIPEPMAEGLTHLGPGDRSPVSELFPGVRSDDAVGAARVLMKLGILREVSPG